MTPYATDTLHHVSCPHCGQDNTHLTRDIISRSLHVTHFQRRCATCNKTIYYTATAFVQLEAHKSIDAQQQEVPPDDADDFDSEDDFDEPDDDDDDFDDDDDDFFDDDDFDDDDELYDDDDDDDFDGEDY